MASDQRAAVLESVLRTARHQSRASLLFRAAIADRLGITASDLECLDFLVEEGSATAGQLARQTRLTTGAITSLIRRLEHAGYVVSGRDPDDQRKVIIRPVLGRLERAAADHQESTRRIGALVEDYTTAQLRFLARHQEAMAAIYLEETR